MKFVTAGKKAKLLIETIDFRSQLPRGKTNIPPLGAGVIRTSVSFEHFIYNGEFDPGSG